MRLAGPSPFGDPPDVPGLIARLRSGGRGVLRCEDRAVDLAPERVRKLAELIDPAPGVPPFQLLYESPVRVEAIDDAGASFHVEIAEDGAVRDARWNAFVAVSMPRAVLAWLAAAGCPGPLDRFDRAESPEARKAWLAAAPPAVRALAEGHPGGLGGAETGPAVSDFERAAGGRAGSIAALLRWYGQGASPLAGRPAYEELPRMLLSPYGLQEVLDTFGALHDPAELRGAGRFVLAGPVSPSMLAQMERTPRDARDAILGAIEAIDPAASEAARLRLFPPPWAPPAGAALVGVSATARLRRVVAGDGGVFAIDGFEVVRLEAGARAVVCPIFREAPMAWFGGHLWVQYGGTVRKYAPGGQLADALAVAGPAEIDAARRIAAAWESAAPAGSVAVVPADEERQAFEAFAHLGCPPPPSAAWAGRAFVEPRAVLRVTPGGSTERLPVPGEIGAWTAGPAGLVLTVHDGPATRVARIAEAGEPAAGASIALPRADLLQILACATLAFLRVAAGAGEAMVAIACP